MTTATNTHHRLDLPKHTYRPLAPDTASDDNDTLPLDWEEGVSHSGAGAGTVASNSNNTALEEKITLLPSLEVSTTSLFDEDTQDLASVAAEKMSLPAPGSAQENSQLNQDAGVLSAQVERIYLHCYTAASISLLCLSVASFVLPSISTYPPERSAVQALGYTAGVISLLSGLAAGASVVAAYTGSGYLHR